MYHISDDKNRLDLSVIHTYLSTESYWAKDIPCETVQKSIDNSLCFAVYRDSDGAQVGFARVITDCATTAYLADVFIIPTERGRGLSKQLMQYIMAYKQLQGLRKFLLMTQDAHELYTQFGFEQLRFPDRVMEITAPRDIYSQQKKQD